MKRYPHLRSLAAVAFALLGLLPLSAQDERPIWEQEAMLIYSDSSGEFNRLRSLGSENRRLALYTQALGILHEQVKVRDNEQPYQESRRLFRILVADDPDDAIGLASAYYLARIAQSNPFEKDISEAKKLYWNLYEKWPDRFFGQMAFAKYATLEVYDDDGSGSHVRERLQKLEPLVKEISLPNIRQNVHRILGEAYVQFDLEPKPAYEHFSKAYDIGIPVDSLRLQVLERLASIGEQLGETERALRAYEEILLIAPFHERREAFEKSAERLRKQLVSRAKEEN